MSAIAATNSSAYNAVATLLNSATSAPDDPRLQSDAPAAVSPTRPSDTVDLSDRAKQVLARAKTDQAAADKLAVLLQSLHSSSGRKSGSPSGDASSSFDQLSGHNKSQSANETSWVAGSKYGDPTISDTDFLTKYKPMLDSYAEGLSPDQRAAMEAAINNGTIQIQKASDIAGLNYHSTVSYTGSPGGLEGMGVTHQSNPTGAAADALKQGAAYAFWTADRGDVYLSW